MEIFAQSIKSIAMLVTPACAYCSNNTDWEWSFSTDFRLKLNIFSK